MKPKRQRKRRSLKEQTAARAKTKVAENHFPVEALGTHQIENELPATREDLQTSKAEGQSANAELQRKIAEREHNQLAAIVESSQDAIISKDLDGLIMSWNAAAERLFGFTADEAVGQPILIIIPPERYGEESKILDQLRHGERVEKYETVRKRKDGTLLEVELMVSPVRDAEGNIIGASKICRDLTENKRLERSLEAAREKLALSNQDLERQVKLRTAELVAANAQLEELVYSIAHDLRAPLRAMEAFSTILLEEHAAQLGDQAKHYAERIRHAASSLDKLVLDLLAYGRAARLEVQLGPVEVQSAWKTAVAQYEHAIRQKKAQVEAVKPLPVVRAHQATLGQVFANLLGNSLKFVAPSVVPAVRLRAEQAGEKVRLWVEDNGIGISPKHYQRIFRIFERLKPSTYPGTGIGLAIVRKGVERMGGRVGVESAPGQGCRFWIELPKA